MALSIWMYMLLAIAAAAASPVVTRTQTIGSNSNSSGILPTLLSRMIIEEATLITRLSIKTAISSIASTSTNIAEIKPEATPETVQGRAATELDPSLQIVFLVLGTLFGLASVVVAVFFGYKQLSIATNQSIAGRNTNERSDDVELGELDAASDEVHTINDLTTRNNSQHVNAEFLRNIETGVVQISKELKSHLVAIWSFVRNTGHRLPLEPPFGRPGEPPHIGHQDHMRTDGPHV
jgi:hypothetical protein